MRRRVREVTSAAIALFLLAGLIAGCGFGSGDAPSEPPTGTTTATGGTLPAPDPVDDGAPDRDLLDGGFAPYEEPVQGGVLEAAVGEAETCWNGLSAAPASRALFGLLGRGLYGYPPTLRRPAAQRLRPEAAADLPLVADDGRSLTIRLRDGLRFPDGTPVTAAAVKESLEFMLDPRTQCPAGGPLAAGTFDALTGLGDYTAAIRAAEADEAAEAAAPGIAGIEVGDARTLILRLERPDPWLPHALAAPWAVLRAPGTPRAADVPARGLLGPYRIDGDAYEVGARLVVDREPSWDGNVAAGMPAGPGENLIDGVDLALAVPPSTQLAQLLDDELDLSLDGSAPPPDALAALLDDPALRSRLYSTPADTLIQLVPRADRAPLSDVRLRRAIDLAVDRRALARLAGGSAAAAPWSAILPTDLLGDRPPRPVRRDREAARRLVRAAGPAAGPRLRLTSAADQASIERAARIERDLEAVGFRVRRTVVTPSDYAAYLHDPGSDFDLALAGWGPSFGDASTVLGPQLVCGRGDNAGGFCDLAFDDRYLEVAVLPLGVGRDAQFANLATDVARDQVPLVVVLEGRRISLIGSRVGNYRWSPVRLVFLSTLFLRP